MEKEKKTKPKYNMWQNSCYMVKLAWKEKEKNKHGTFDSKGPFAKYARGPLGAYMAAGAAFSVMFMAVAYVWRGREPSALAKSPNTLPRSLPFPQDFRDLSPRSAN